MHLIRLAGPHHKKGDGGDLHPKALLLLPGLDGTGSLFADFVAALPPTMRAQVVRYPTDKFLGYPELSSLVGEVVLPEEAFVVVAESFSTPLAVKLAATRPLNLVGLVICAGFVTNPVAGWLLHLKPLVRSFTFGIPPPGVIINHFMIGAHAPAKLREDVRRTLRSVSPKVMALRVRAVMACDAREDLINVQVPILYIQARHDRLVGGDCFIEIQQLKPDTIWASISAPHFVLQREPDCAAATVIEFMQGLPVSGSL